MSELSSWLFRATPYRGVLLLLAGVPLVRAALTPTAPGEWDTLALSDVEQRCWDPAPLGVGVPSFCRCVAERVSREHDARELEALSREEMLAAADACWLEVLPAPPEGSRWGTLERSRAIEHLSAAAGPDLANCILTDLEGAYESSESALIREEQLEEVVIRCRERRAR